MKNSKNLVLTGAVSLALVSGIIPHKNASAELSAAEKKTIVAKINGKPLRLSDLEKIRNSDPQLSKTPLRAVFVPMRQALVLQQVMYGKAEEKKIHLDPKVQEKIKFITQQLIGAEYVKNEVEKKLTDAKIRELYNQGVKKFKAVDEVKARHVVVDTEEKANEVLKKANSGSDFKQLVGENSIAQFKKNDGEINFQKGATPKAFADVVFKLKAGEVHNKPIQSPYGWHVLKVESKGKSKAPSFAEMKETLKNDVRMIEAQKLTKALMNEANVQLYNYDGTPTKQAPKS